MEERVTAWQIILCKILFVLEVFFLIKIIRVANKTKTKEEQLVGWIRNLVSHRWYRLRGNGVYFRHKWGDRGVQIYAHVALG